MAEVLYYISIAMIPAMITIILAYGAIKRVNLYDAFVEGAAEGFQSAIRIMPYLVAIFLAIGIFRDSGALEGFTGILSPLAYRLGIPPEILPLAIMRPVSGSGALGIVNDLIHTYGPDSFIGRVVSTMMGSAETILYTMAVYFGSVGIKDGRYTLGVALFTHFIAVIASVIVCRIVFFNG